MSEQEHDQSVCRICQSPSSHACDVYGEFSHRHYEVRRCLHCRYAFISDPWTDWEAIYDRDYYSGRGADKLINYSDELENPATSRRHEWKGILRWAAALAPINTTTSWLDYGCGSGGLVRYLRNNGVPNACGFERGSGADIAREHGVPLLAEDDVVRRYRSFDIVTLIEVIEHTIDPVGELRRIRSLLKPNGLLIVTTGNAAPFRNRLHRWRYVVPEVHISFFEPATLVKAMQLTGFEPFFPGYVDGWTDIIRFKLLKNLGFQQVRSWERFVPWEVVGRLIDMRLRLTCHPVGRAIG